MGETGDEWNISWYSDSSGNDSDYRNPPFRPQDGLVAAVLFIIMIVTVAGNVLTLTSFLMDDKLRMNISNWYLVNLSFADLLVGCISLPFNLISYIAPYDWALSEGLCKFYLTVDLIATWESIAAIILISLDRYWLLTRELQYKMKQNQKQTASLCGLTWLLIGVAALFLIWGFPEWTPNEFIEYEHYCDFEFLYHMSTGVAYSVISFFIPMGALVFLNTRVFLNVRKRSQKTSPSNWELTMTAASSVAQTAGDISPIPGHTRKAQPAAKANTPPMNTVNDMAHGSNSNINTREQTTNHRANGRSNSSGQEKKYIKTAKVLLIIVGAYVVCWAPYNMALLITHFCEDSCIPDIVWTISLRLLWFNSALNPFLYAWGNTRIRQNFKKLLLCRTCK